jgi:hypothetical protein
MRKDDESSGICSTYASPALRRAFQVARRSRREPSGLAMTPQLRCPGFQPGDYGNSEP